MTATSTPSLRFAPLALAALCFHAIFAMAGFDGPVKPEYGAVIALLLMLAQGSRAVLELARQPVARWLGVFILFAVAHAAYATWVVPSIAYSRQLTAVAELVRLGIFSCVIGWWLSRMPRVIPLLFGLMVVGLLFAIALRMPWADLASIWEGQRRPKFGLPENMGGLLAALASWASMCLLFLPWQTRGRLRWRRAGLVAGMLAYAGSFSALLFSQSRGAWLAYGAMLPVLAYGIMLARRRGDERPFPWLPVVSVALISLLLLAAANGILAKRFAGAEQLLPEIAATEEASSPARSAEAHASSPTTAAHVRDLPASHSPTMPAAIDKDSEANNTAVAVRMSLYGLGIVRWQERPLLGWGLRTTPVLIATSGLDLAGQQHAHLHNAYLDALVGLGVVGAGLLGLLLFLLLRELLRSWRSRLVPDVEFWLVAGSLGIIMIANGFDSLLWRDAHVRAPLEIVLGCCVAYGIIRRRRKAVIRADGVGAGEEASGSR